MLFTVVWFTLALATNLHLHNLVKYRLHPSDIIRSEVNHVELSLGGQHISLALSATKLQATSETNALLMIIRDKDDELVYPSKSFGSENQVVLEAFVAKDVPLQAKDFILVALPIQPTASTMAARQDHLYGFLKANGGHTTASEVAEGILYALESIPALKNDFYLFAMMCGSGKPDLKGATIEIDGQDRLSIVGNQDWSVPFGYIEEEEDEGSKEKAEKEPKEKEEKAKKEAKEKENSVDEPRDLTDEEIQALVSQIEKNASDYQASEQLARSIVIEEQGGQPC